MDDTVKLLLRFVARGFYQVPHVLILDAVMLHSVLSDDDLLHLLEIKKKELRAYCNKLVDDRLLATHVQKEEHPQQRAMSRTYYYIHITEAIDAIKWKIHSVVNTLKKEMSNYGNPSGYVCSRCHRKVSQLDAISMLSADQSEFLCDVCNGVLVEDDSSQQAQIKQEKLEKLMTQVDPIITFLKKIDESPVIDNDFEQAMMKQIPAQSVSTTASLGRPRKHAASQMAADASRAQATLQVSITANDKDLEREQEEKEERRLKLEQNALPSWHSASTVGQETLGKFTSDEEEKKPFGEDVEVKEEAVPQQSTSQIKDKEAQDALAAYYAQLAEREQQEADDDDDDDEDEFDDL
ncbi:transcription initiation factor IIE subunit alpha [Diutina catenulata]